MRLNFWTIVYLATAFCVFGTYAYWYGVEKSVFSNVIWWIFAFAILGSVEIIIAPYIIYLMRKQTSKSAIALICVANIIILLTIIAIAHTHGKIDYQLEKKHQKDQSSLLE